jgi:ArsR family transcriptional regulator
MKQSDLAKIFKALSSEQRLKLFTMIYQAWNKQKLQKTGSDCSCSGVMKQFTEACKKMNLSRSTISHHFKELENSGLITCVREGQACSCTVNEKALEQVRGFLK